jgi:membrane dipeptidase
MKPTGLIDLHCDTLTADTWDPKAAGPDALDNPARALALSKMPAGLRWAQCFAIFIPDDLRGQAAIDHFEAHADLFDRQMQKFSDIVSPCRSFGEMQQAFAQGRFAAILTVEGGAALAGDPLRAAALAARGVRMLTLVWNGANELASGQQTGGGLTGIGRLAVHKLEAHNIILDVSHLNDRGFDELCQTAQKPFVASHSNARRICGHKRNLTDGQVDEIVRRKGLIGLNFYVRFLRRDGDVKSLDDLYRHASYLLGRGAKDCLALGSDYDGADLPECLDSVEKSLTILDYFVSRGIPEQTADAILYTNAQRFFRDHLG